MVATSSVTDATPACFVAHEPDRYMEKEIAKDFLESDIDVVIGGGEKFFVENFENKTEFENYLTDRGYEFSGDINELKNSKNKKLFALLSNNALPPAGLRNYNLGELAKTAIDKLSQNEKGFFLMVEGSQIDWANHDNLQEQSIKEIEDFNTAVKFALDFAEQDGNTLVVVVADHETGGMSITDGSLATDSLKFSWTSKKHSANFIALFAYGPGQEQFHGIMNNNIVGRKLFEFYSDHIDWKD